MKLYETVFAPNGRRVRIFLAEKNITVTIVPVDLGKGEHMLPEFTRINPLQQVPALVLDDGTVITESLAICRYFEEMQPQPSLFGETARERVEIEMWQRRIEFGLFLPVTYVFRHTHPAMAEMEKPQIEQWAEVNKARVAQALELIDAHLKANRFITGASYSVADITAQVAIGFLRPARLTAPENLPHLGRWLAEVSERASAKA